MTSASIRRNAAALNLQCDTTTRAHLAIPVILIALAITLSAWPVRAQTPAEVSETQSSAERGKQVFSVNCSFCHGSGARGGEGGPNLLRSPLVLNDRNGEILAAVVQNGRPDRGMPKFVLNADTISDIAAYLHSIPINGVETSFNPNSILVGNPTAGKAYFYGKGKCSHCHSLKGDFSGIGSKYDAKTLQDNIITGAAVGMLGAPSPGAPPRIATVTFSSGEVINGTLIAVDDFNVSVTDASGNRRSFRRAGASPRVEIEDPMQAHRDMLREWEDRDLHDLTAFLVKQK